MSMSELAVTLAAHLVLTNALEYLETGTITGPRVSTRIAEGWGVEFGSCSVT